MGRVVLGAINLLVVGVNDLVGGEEEGGASVSNGVGVITEVGGGGELPEALAGVDIGVENVGSIARDGTEDVSSGLLVLEVSNEERGVEAAGDVVEPGLLLVGGDSVDGGEGKTEETVVGAGLELGGDLLGGLNGLSLNAQGTDGDNVSVDITGGRRTVTVADGPSLTRELLGGAGVAGGVDVVAAGAAGGLVREDPEIGRTGIEVKVEGLGGGTNVYLDEVLEVITIRSSGGAAVVTLDSVGLGNSLTERLGDGSAILGIGTSQSKRTVAASELGVGRSLKLERALLRDSSARDHGGGEDRDQEATESRSLHLERCCEEK